MMQQQQGQFLLSGVQMVQQRQQGQQQGRELTLTETETLQNRGALKDQQTRHTQQMLQQVQL